MKKTGLIFGCLLVAAGLFGQTQLKETLVEAPRFTAKTSGDAGRLSKKSPIYNYMQDKIQNAQDVTFDHEGVVVVHFIVESDGTLSKLSVRNSIDDKMDQCVVNCLNSTSGMWEPGKVNGNPVPMESKVYVRFDIPGNRSHEDNARLLLAKGLRHFDKGKMLQEFPINRDKSAQRQFARCLNHLGEATVFQPEEPDIVFWQACAYEKAGDDLNRDLKLKEFMELLNGPINYEPEMAEIVISGGR